MHNYYLFSKSLQGPVNRLGYVCKLKSSEWLRALDLTNSTMGRSTYDSFQAGEHYGRSCSPAPAVVNPSQNSLQSPTHLLIRSRMIRS
jgi:hypothetical protein